MVATEYQALMRELRAAAKKFKATVSCESVGTTCCWQVDAPNGFIWCEGEVHAIKVEWSRGDNAWRADAIQDAISRTQYGIQPCYCPDCAGS